jgi:hypothetical protein
MTAGENRGERIPACRVGTHADARSKMKAQCVRTSVNAARRSACATPPPTTEIKIYESE